MHRVRFVILVLASGFLSSCAGVPSITAFKEGESSRTIAQRQLLVGSWQGRAPTKDGGSRTWIVQRNGDGTYRIDFVFREPSGVISKQSEAGIWGTSAGFYFTATRSFAGSDGFKAADTTDPALYDLYKIISLTRDTFEYQNLSTGNRFIVKRIHGTTSTH